MPCLKECKEEAQSLFLVPKIEPLHLPWAGQNALHVFGRIRQITDNLVSGS